MMRIVFMVVFLSLLGNSYAAYPCDGAWEAMLELQLCTYTTNNSYYMVVFYRSLYGALDPAIRDSILDSVGVPHDEDGTIACGQGIEEIRSCVTSAFSSCSADTRAATDDAVDMYRNTLCGQVDGTWKYTDLAITYLDDLGSLNGAIGESGQFSSGFLCITNAIAAGTLQMQDSDCFTNLGEDLTSYYTSNSYPAARPEMARTWAAMIKCSYLEILRLGCSGDAVKGFMAYMVIFSTPPGMDYTIEDLDRLLGKTQNPTGEKRATVIVFGDPHLLTFDGENYGSATCAALGYQKYFENVYVKVYGYNEKAIPGDMSQYPPTYMTAVWVELTDRTSTYSVYNYTVDDVSLPSTFINGNVDVNGGFSAGGASVTIDVQRRVTKVTAKPGGLSIGMRKAGNTVVFSMRMEESMYVGATGLLVDGCPGETIDISAASRRRRGVSNSSACADMGLSGRMLEGCEFDVGIVGDSVLTDYENIEEVSEVTEEDDDSIISVDDGAEESSASEAMPHVLFTVVALVISSIM